MTPVQPRVFYGWYVVASAFVILCLGFGAAYSFAAFFPPLRDEFHATRSDTSLVFGIAGFLYFGLGALTGPLADRIGPRRVVATGMVLTGGGLLLASRAQTLQQVYFTYSLGVGLGVGFAYVPTVGAIQRWFVRQRGSASGLGVSGIGVGTLVVPLAANALIDLEGWRTAYAVLGLLTLAAGVPAALLLEHSPARKRLLPDGEHAQPGAAATAGSPAGFTVRQALAARQFWLLYAATMTTGLALFIPFVHLVPFARDHGAGGGPAALLVGMIGVGSTAGRVGMGPAADRLGRRQALVMTFVMMSCSFLLWLVSPGYATLLVFALWFGAAYGGFVALVPALTADYFGGRNVGAILGMLYTGAAFGALVGPPFAGTVFDVRGSYALPIAFGAAMNALATICVLRLRPPGAQPPAWRTSDHGT
jgi:MFS family permease